MAMKAVKQLGQVVRHCHLVTVDGTDGELQRLQVLLTAANKKVWLRHAAARQVKLVQVSTFYLQ
jgi:lysozyme family protein